MNLIIIHRFLANCTVLSGKAQRHGHVTPATGKDKAGRSEVQPQLQQLRPCLKTIFLNFLLHLIIYLCVYVFKCACEWAHIYTIASKWKTKDNLWKFVFSFIHIGPRNQIQVVSLGGKCPYLSNHLSESQKYL